MSRPLHAATEAPTLGGLLRLSQELYEQARRIHVNIDEPAEESQYIFLLKMFTVHVALRLVLGVGRRDSISELPLPARFAPGHHLTELTYQAVAEAYEAERALYVTLAEAAEERIKSRLERERIYADVRGRAKETESFVVKSLVGQRYSDPMNEIGDKAGVRVVVPFLRQVDQVELIARELFTVLNREQKLDALAYNEVGYLGVHLDARLTDEDAAEMGEEFAHCPFEIQIRTIAQSAWAEVTHDQLYKPPAEVPNELKRRIYRLVSLVELFDNEVEAFLVEAARTPGLQEALRLVPLTKMLLERFGVRQRPDRSLSLLMAGVLVPLYGDDAGSLKGIESWVDENAEHLQRIYDDCGDKACPPILLQAESFLLFERLDRDPDAVLGAWPEELPRRWLEEAASLWGVRLPDVESQAFEKRPD